MSIRAASSEGWTNSHEEQVVREIKAEVAKVHEVCEYPPELAILDDCLPGEVELDGSYEFTLLERRVVSFFMDHRQERWRRQTYDCYSHDNTRKSPCPCDGWYIPYPRLDAWYADFGLLSLALVIFALGFWLVHREWRAGNAKILFKSSPCSVVQRVYSDQKPEASTSMNHAAYYVYCSRDYFRQRPTLADTFSFPASSKSEHSCRCEGECQNSLRRRPVVLAFLHVPTWPHYRPLPRLHRL